jgi:hypothetical protein
MDLQATIPTHESIVHAQVLSIEKLLQREIQYQIMLNVQGTRSQIKFLLSENEAQLIRDNLGYKIAFTQLS